MKCKHCNKDLKEGWNYCPFCGRCKICGKQIPECKCQWMN